MTNKNFEEAKRVLAEKGEFTNTVTGTSMMPLLRQGRDIIVVKSPCFPLKKHDVPLYKKPGTQSLVLHRIIKEPQDDIYIIRGDNTYSLEYVRECEIVGVLSGFFRNGKYHRCGGFLYNAYVFSVRLFFPVKYTFKIILPVIIKKLKLKKG